MIEPFRRNLRDFLGKRASRRMSALEEGIVIRQFDELALDRLYDFSASISQAYIPQSRHSIENAHAIIVKNIDPLAVRNHTGSALVQLGVIGERVQMMGRIQRLQLGSWRVIRHNQLFR